VATSWGVEVGDDVKVGIAEGLGDVMHFSKSLTDGLDERRRPYVAD
jgi:hypothetical protein